MALKSSILQFNLFIFIAKAENFFSVYFFYLLIKFVSLFYFFCLIINALTYKSEYHNFYVFFIIYDFYCLKVFINFIIILCIYCIIIFFIISFILVRSSGKKTRYRFSKSVSDIGSSVELY